MSGNTTVDRAEMQRAANQIDEKANAIDGVQKTLQGEISGLINTGWVGNAANQFLNAFQEFDAQFVKVQQALVGIHEKLTDTQMKYTSTEEDQAQASSSISAILNG